jgi:hypothetical protein
MTEQEPNPLPETTLPEMNAAEVAQDTEEQPMIEVHTPHEGIHTWKDAFIHIGIIVVGLLIAVGLDRTVVYFEHRHQLQEAREQLLAEQNVHREDLQWDINAVQNLNAQLDNDMALLREHQSKHTPLGSKLYYSWDWRRFPEGAWQAVQQNGTLSLMSYEELEQYDFLYSLSDRQRDAVIEFGTQIEIAAAIAERAPDGNLSPQDTEDLIRATSEAKGKLAYAAKLFGYDEKYRMPIIDRIESEHR